MVKVILKENIPGHGEKNDIVKVSDGFARNFLIPKGKAVAATPSAIKAISQEKNKIELQEKKKLNSNLKIKEAIEKLKIKIQKKAKGGKLFGSLTSKDIAEALEKKDVKINPKSIQFKNVIKNTGEYKISISLDKNTKADLDVTVEEEV